MVRNGLWGAAGEDFDDFCDGGAVGVAEFVATSVATLAVEAAEEVGEALVDFDAEVAAGLAGVGDLVLVEDAAERNFSFENEVADGGGEAVEVDADGAEFNWMVVVLAAQDDGADEVVRADEGASVDVEFDG